MNDWAHYARLDNKSIKKTQSCKGFNSYKGLECFSLPLRVKWDKEANT